MQLLVSELENPQPLLSGGYTAVVVVGVEHLIYLHLVVILVLYPCVAHRVTSSMDR